MLDVRKKIVTSWVGVALLAMSYCSALIADENLVAANTPNTAAKVNKDDIAHVRKTISTLAPGLKPDSIKPVSIPALYEVVLGADVLYITADGKYMFQGDLVDVAAKVNITEEARAKGRLKIVNDVDESTMIVYAPKDDEVKDTVTIFTDIDCPYCRKMHKQMADYNRLGIKIRYLAFPRAGIGSESFDKAVAVWCAEDPAQAMTDAKAGFGIPELAKDCKSPVKEHLALVRMLGLSGTPSIILKDGSLIPGYVPPQRLRAILNELPK